MMIYNVTINTDDSVHEEWLVWIKTHIPKVLGTGKFTKALFTRVMVEEEQGGITYSIQYHAHSKAHLEAYYKENAVHLRQEGQRKFADKMLAFRTELEIVDEYNVSLN